MEIRRSYDRLISTMGFPLPVRCHLYIESGPWLHMSRTPSREAGHRRPSQNRLPIGQFLSIVIALAVDGLRTRRLKSVTFTDFNKELAFILNFGMIGWKACPRRLWDGLITTIEDKQNNQRNFLFMIDHWLLHGFIEGFEHAGNSDHGKFCVH